MAGYLEEQSIRFVVYKVGLGLAKEPLSCVPLYLYGEPLKNRAACMRMTPSLSYV